MRKKLVKVRFDNKKKYIFLYPTHYELHETDKIKIVNNNNIEKVEIVDIFYKNLDDDRRFRYLEVYDPKKHKNFKTKKKLNINYRNLIKKILKALLIITAIVLLILILNFCLTNISLYYKNIGISSKRELLKHIYHYWTDDLSYFAKETIDWFTFKINLYKSIIYILLSLIVIAFIVLLIIKFIKKTITEIKIRKAEYKFKDIDNDFDYYLDHYFDDFDSFEEFLNLYLQGKMYKRNRDAFNYLNDKYYLFYKNGRRR